jgi:hypothetical protein
VHNMRKLKSRRVLAIDDGEYRVFVSVYYLGQRLSFGFPKKNCRNLMVWVGRADQLICWLSIADARANLGTLFKSQCVPVLAQCGECESVISPLKTPIVLAKRLLGAYQKVEISAQKLRNTELKRHVAAVRPKRPVHPRESQRGAKWTSTEDSQLRDEVAAGQTMVQIASSHGRNEGAISSRIAKLGLMEDNLNSGDI